MSEAITKNGKTVLQQDIMNKQSSHTGQPRYESYTMILHTYNEEARIRRVVEYYRPFAKLFVVDNFSSDNTTAILDELGVPYLKHRNPGTIQTPECIKYLSSLADTDYILFLACSEFFSPRLLALFDEIATACKYDLVSCVRDSYTSGELIPLWGGRLKMLDASVQRFMNRNAIDYDKVRIHGSYVPYHNDRVLSLPREEGLVIAHLRDADALSLIEKSAEYAAVEAKHRLDRRNEIGIVRLSFLFIREVLRFLQLPISQWNRIALREVWARMVMHSIIYWVGWELRSGTTLAHSQQRSDELWKALVRSAHDQSTGA